MLAPLFFTGCGAFIFFFFFMKRSAKKGGGDGGERETPYESWMRARSAPAAADPQVTPELQPEVESTHNPMVHASALPPPPPLSTPLVDIETPAVDVEEQEEGTISKEDGNMTEFYGEHSDRVSAVDNPLNAGSEENIDL